MKAKMKSMFLALASLAGLWPGRTYGFANEKAKTSMSADFWKGKHAQLLGKPELADGSDEDQLKAHDEHMKLANDMEDSEDLPAEMENEKKTEMGSLLANAITDGRIKAEDKTSWETKFANDFDATKAALSKVKKSEVVPAANEAEEKLRKENVDLQLANAVTSGRITSAQRKEWEGKFANDYDGTKTALAALKPVVKTAPTTTGLRQREVQTFENEKKRREKVIDLVNEKMTKTFGKYRADKYDQVFASVQADHPELFKDAVA
jgi:hypothetical protein